MSDKTIILRLDRPPQFVGQWTNGETRAALVAALQWLDGLMLTAPEPAGEDRSEDG